MIDSEPLRVLFVCTGNICRSPMAEVVLRALGDARGLGDRLVTGSAGTGDWHVGECADERTLEALSRRGYDGARHRARQFSVSSFAENDLVVALDRTHERILRAWARSEDDEGKVSLLRDYDPDAASRDVPDPYYAGPGTFDAVLAMIESATRGLFSQLEPALRANRVPSRVFRGAEQEEYR